MSRIKDIYYENHNGEKIYLLAAPYRLQTGDLFNWSWDYDSTLGKKGGVITDFSKGIQEKSVLLGVMAGNQMTYEEALDHFAEVTEKDILDNSPGKLWIGEYYLSCYAIQSDKEEWEYCCDELDNTVTFASPYPYWVKETTMLYKKQDQEADETDPDYPHDYPRDYRKVAGVEYLNNDHYAPSDFVMRIFGPCVNPEVTIAGHLYNVNVYIGDGEYLEIDSRQDRRNLAIILHGIYGTEDNCFGKRNVDSSPFKNIPPGVQVLTWPAVYDIEITLLQERSEPKWT